MGNRINSLLENANFHLGINFNETTAKNSHFLDTRYFDYGTSCQNYVHKIGKIARMFSYSNFIKHVESGQVAEVTFKGKAQLLVVLEKLMTMVAQFKLFGNTGEATIKVLREK